MRPYSTDFRQKVVQADERGDGSQRDLAQLFSVRLSFVHDLLRRYRHPGRVEPKPQGGAIRGRSSRSCGSCTHSISNTRLPRWPSAVSTEPLRPRSTLGVRRGSGRSSNAA